MLPQSNATLTAIGGGGLSEDDGGGYAEGTDTSKWSGIAEAYVHEEVLAVAGDTGLNEARQTYIVIPGDLVPAVAVVPEDRITYTYAGTSRTGTVRHVEGHVLAGHQKTVRLYFRDT